VCKGWIKCIKVNFKKGVVLLSVIIISVVMLSDKIVLKKFLRHFVNMKSQLIILGSNNLTSLTYPDGL
jgi:hypothetical protein